MENLFNPWNLPALRAGKLPSPIPANLPLQQLAVADLVAFAAEVIERPDEFPPGLRALFAWLERPGHHVDIEDLRVRHPEVAWQRYGDWVESQRARFRELCPHETPVGAR